MKPLARSIEGALRARLSYVEAKYAKSAAKQVAKVQKEDGGITMPMLRHLGVNAKAMDEMKAMKYTKPGEMKYGLDYFETLIKSSDWLRDLAK